MTSLVSLISESAVPPLHEKEVPLPHIMYGIIPMALFLALLAFLWMFRNNAAKLGLHDPYLRSEQSATESTTTGRDGH